MLLLSLLNPSTASAQCEFAVPQSAAHPESIVPTDLAADYRLTMLPWQPSGPAWHPGVLHLERPASPTSAELRNPDLIGWLAGPSDRSGWQDLGGSRDPKRPGVTVHHFGIRIASQGGLDGFGYNLVITAVTATGLWGYWQEDAGFQMAIDTATHQRLPDAAGFFCALRVRASQ